MFAVGANDPTVIVSKIRGNLNSAEDPSLCRLQTNTTYYLNIRNERIGTSNDGIKNLTGIDSCGSYTGGTCSMGFTTHYADYIAPVYDCAKYFAGEIYNASATLYPAYCNPVSSSGTSTWTKTVK